MCKKIAYGSEYLAQNAVTLHMFAQDDCIGIHYYTCNECGEYHIGHKRKSLGRKCKAHRRRRLPSAYRQG